MPITLIIFCFLASRLLKRKKLRKWAFTTGLTLLIFLSNPFIANEIFLLWEIPPTPIHLLKDQYSVGIVLTGITNMEKSPKDRTYFNKGADRIIHALQLYQEKKIKKILISGGSGSIFNKDVHEAEQLKWFLILANVDEKDIILEDKSRNTYENAINTAAILKEKYANGTFLLITSSFHLRRAKACFNRSGLKTVAYGTDYYSHDRNFNFDTLFFPSINAFNKWTILVKELIGITAYKLRGYI